jgi:hypothetical protein
MSLATVIPRASTAVQNDELSGSYAARSSGFAGSLVSKTRTPPSYHEVWSWFAVTSKLCEERKPSTDGGSMRVTNSGLDRSLVSNALMPLKSSSSGSETPTDPGNVSGPT